MPKILSSSSNLNLEAGIIYPSSTHTHICPRDDLRQVVECEDKECDGYRYCDNCSQLFQHIYYATQRELGFSQMIRRKRG